VARHLDEDDARILEAVCRFLGAHGGPGHARAMFEKIVISAESRWIKEDAALPAIARLGGAAFRKDCAAAFASATELTQLAILAYLQRVGPGEEEKLLREALRSPRSRVRARALESLSELRVADGAELARQGLKDPESGVRAAAVEALAARAGAASVPEIGPFRSDPSRQVRWAAVIALARLAPDPRTADVQALLGATDPSRRYAVRRLLAREMGEAAAPVLLQALEDPVDYVREDAARILCGWGRREGIDVLLESSQPFRVNAVRRPEAWKRMASAKFDAPLLGTREEVLGQLAAAAGLRIEFSTKAQQSWDLTDPAQAERGQTVLEAIEEVQEGFSGVLEDDRLRILTPAEAGEALRDWWLAEQAKK
jgi:HEAT repeat protein